MKLGRDVYGAPRPFLSATTLATLIAFIGSGSLPVFAAQGQSSSGQSATQTDRPPNRSYNGLEFPSDAVIEFNLALDARLTEDAEGLTPTWGRHSDGNFLDENGDPVSPSTVNGLLLTREIYVAQMNSFADYLDSLTTLTRGDRIEMAERLSEAAADVAFVHGRMESLRETAQAARSQAPWNGLSERNRYESGMREADRMEADGDTAGAEQLRRSWRENNEWGQYLDHRRQYYALLDQNPILGLHNASFTNDDDETPYLWQVLAAEASLNRTLEYPAFKERVEGLDGVEGVDVVLCDGEPCIRVRVADGNASAFDGEFSSHLVGTPIVVVEGADPPTASWVSLSDYLRSSATETRRLAAEAAALTEFEDIWQFGTPRYTPQQRTGMQLAQVTGSDYVGLLIEDARWNVSGATLETATDDAAVDITLAGLAALSLLIPVIGPFIAAGLAVVQIYRDGTDLYAVYGDIDSAEATATVTGFQYLGTLEDKAEGAESKLFVSVAAGTFDLLDGVFTGLRLVRQARAPLNSLDAGVPPLLARPGTGPDSPPAAGTGARAAGAVDAAGDDLLLPNGVRARTYDLDESAINGLMGRIDEDRLGELFRMPAHGDPGDGAFFLDNGLFPVTAVESGGRRFYLSRPYMYEGRVSVVAFEETAAGTLVPRTFYLSGEHGIWRAATSMRGGWIGKGPSVMQGDEVVAVNKAGADLGVELQGALGRHLERQGILDVPDDVAGRAFSAHVEFEVGEGSAELGQWANGVDVNLPMPDSAGTLTPDFAAGPLDWWAYDHPLYGRVEAATYRSTDGNALMLVLRDTEGRTWVPSIQNADAGLTPFGTRWSAWQPGSLNDTPIIKDSGGGRNVPVEGRDGYFWNPEYRNGFNEQFLLFGGDFDPIGSLAGVRAPQVPPPAGALGGAAGTGGTRSAGRAGATGLGEAAAGAGLAGEATHGLRALMEANDIRTQEIVEELQDAGLPTDVDELSALLDAIPAGLQGENHDRIRRLRDQLGALEAKGDELLNRMGADAATRDASPAASAGPGNASGSSSSTGGNVDLADVGSGGPVDDLVQKMVIEIKNPDGSSATITIQPSSARELPVVLPAGVAAAISPMPEPSWTARYGVIRDPMAAPRRIVFAGAPQFVAARAVPIGYSVKPTAATTTGLPIATTSATSLSSAPAVAGAAWRRSSALSRPRRRPGQPMVEVFLRNVGSSTGEAFVAQIFNHGDAPIDLDPGALLVEPLQQQAQQMLQQQLSSRLGNLNPMQLDLNAYCMEFLKLPPVADSMFQIASKQLQEQIGPVADILEASQRLMDVGALVPDSDPMGYFHSIRQWSIWTQEQGFDLSGFASAFVQHTRKQLEEAGRPWEDGFESVLRSAAGNRWGDIQRVLSAAQQIARED